MFPKVKTANRKKKKPYRSSCHKFREGKAKPRKQSNLMREKGKKKEEEKRVEVVGGRDPH